MYIERERDIGARCDRHADLVAHPQEEEAAPWLRTNGVNTNGSSVVVVHGAGYMVPHTVVQQHSVHALGCGQTVSTLMGPLQKCN